jgi:hypothetical protein
VHSVDWILTEVLRLYYGCEIATARKIADSINEANIPVIADVDGFLRVQNTALDFRSKILVILYHKSPAKVSDTALIKWTRYSNSSTFKRDILPKLDAEALIHYQEGFCLLLPKGCLYVERNIPMELIV